MKLQAVDNALELIGLFFIFTQWLLTLLSYHSLPRRIPVHFNMAEQADRFGEKWLIWIIPSIATLVYAGLTILNHYPHIFNYPTPITAANAQRQYTYATRLIRYVKTIFALMLGYISYQVIEYAKGITTGLGHWFLPLSLMLVFIPLVYVLFKSFQAREQ